MRFPALLALVATTTVSLAAEDGAQVYNTLCVACHGPDGKGMQAVGAPNLTDKIWLHGWGEQTIVGMINGGKNNHMPAQEGRLTPSQIHVLTAYVWGLSNR